MATLTVGKKIDAGVDDRQDETVIAVFPTADGNFKFVFKLEECDPLKVAEQTRTISPANLM